MSSFEHEFCKTQVIFFLKGLRHLVIQSLMRAGLIVKPNTFSYTLSKMPFWSVTSAVCFFPLKRGEEDLSHCVVNRLPRCGEADCFTPHFYNREEKSFEIYCFPRSLWKVRFCGSPLSWKATLKATATRFVLIRWETRQPMILRKYKSEIIQK